MVRYSITRAEDLDGSLLLTESARMSLSELASFVGSLRRRGEPYAFHPGQQLSGGYYVKEYRGIFSGILDSVQVVDIVAPEIERHRLKEKDTEIYPDI